MLPALLFRHNECPDDTTFIEYVKSSTNWGHIVSSLITPSVTTQDLYIKTISNSREVLEEIEDLYEKLGKVYWRSQDPRELSGLSLSYNPEHNPLEWKMGSFGHPRYLKFSKKDYFNQPRTDQPLGVKNDYLDSYGFRKLLPEMSEYNSLSKLMNSFSLPVIRATVRTIDGGYCYPTNTPDGGMHRDDSIFEMIRINICLSNNGNFGLQYDEEDPIFPAPGDMYAINSDRPHRVYVNKFSYFKRTHLVIGLSPWLDYNAANDTWSTNQFFGKVHPIDIIKQRLFLKKV